jgi:hypothetical protein
LFEGEELEPWHVSVVLRLLNNVVVIRNRFANTQWFHWSVCRVVSKLDLGDYEIPAGSTLALNIQAVHHNPKYWPHPMEFDPHRFMGQETRSLHILAILGRPTVNCLGQHLSLLESKIVLALLTQRYDFRIRGEIVTELGCRDTDPRAPIHYSCVSKRRLECRLSRKDFSWCL